MQCRYAVMCGAMSWISDENLVAAVSNAGCFGVVAGGAMSPDRLRDTVLKTKALTGHSFGVNIVLAHPQLQELIDVCGQEGVSHIILAGGIPDKQMVEKSHQYNMKCLAFAPSLAIAKRLQKIGVDALIIEGSEAGGHVGSVSTLVLTQEILMNLDDVPIFVAGGIVRGEVFASMLLLGAAGCQMGTLFACCTESTAHERFKKAFFSASSRNAVTSVQLDKKFPVTAVRALENHAYCEFMQKQKDALLKYESGEWSLEEARLSLEHFWAGALRRAAVDGDIETGSIMAGQSVGLLKQELPVQSVIDILLSEADSYLSKLCDILCR